MASKVYFGGARQSRLSAEETLPMKLDRIIDALHLRDRVQGETVAIKMHLGGNVGYSTVHPVFVRRIVQAVKEGGGKPFVTDSSGSVMTAAERGYTAETLGCPIYPVAGPDEKYYYTHTRPYKNIQEWGLGGMIQDATFLIDLAHVKGHPTCGFGGAFKNLALGCMIWPTRSAIHDTMHYDKYWFKELCPDAATRQAIIESCPFGALVEDRENPEEIHVHFDNCNQCGRCLQVAPPGSLKIDPVNFASFQEANAIAVSLVLSTFEPGKAVFFNIAAHMTPVCDCFGFTGAAILPDVGVFGSDDIVALEQATLDVIARYRLIEENVPLSMEVHTRQGHPFQWLHGPYKNPYLVVEYGEKLGLGTREYELIDVMPLEKIERRPLEYIAAAHM
ncbi:MAG: DUF362 domain-containing protein [Anaerolineae bacterium]|nr:DUF362 domain-containing protein [Anaerolineae bacterium]MDW8098368.1 DUF362 domain-containing protein [Anaerolineae bacterium]